MNRRNFLKMAGVGTVFLGGGGYFYLDDKYKHPVLERDGKILCDLHAHPPNDVPLDDLVNFLGKPGLIGLSQRYENNKILTYERAREIIGNDTDFQELTDGQLARFREGYFVRSQELKGGIHHFLALGWDGDYIQDKDTPQAAIDAIHEQNGVVIFNHPYTIPCGIGFRIANSEEREIIKGLLSKVDEVEVHNAFNVNYFGIGMRESNKLALKIVQDNGRHRGTASSDCHRDLEQTKICGIYIEKDVIDTEGMNGLKNELVEGNFERYGDPEKGPYISRLSFTMTMILPRIERILGI